MSAAAAAAAASKADAEEKKKKKEAKLEAEREAMERLGLRIDRLVATVETSDARAGPAVVREHLKQLIAMAKEADEIGGDAKKKVDLSVRVQLGLNKCNLYLAQRTGKQVAAAAGRASLVRALCRGSAAAAAAAAPRSTSPPPSPRSRARAARAGRVPGQADCRL